ncbi:MAG: hypothetical protein GY930_00240 [bacterium]|nr:hypothetical protein [bacterium]
MKLLPPTFFPSLLLVSLATSCTIAEVDSREGPPRIVSHGMVEGHAAFGILAEEQFLDIDVFDGTSQGAFFELGLWKLLRLELGFAGASASVGPFHLGLGVLSYEPRVPCMNSEEVEDEVEACDSKRSCCDGDSCKEVDSVPAESEEVVEYPDDPDPEADSIFEVDPGQVTKA